MEDLERVQIEKFLWFLGRIQNRIPNTIMRDVNTPKDI